MKTRIYLIGIGIIIGLISCAKKNYATCGLTSEIKNENFDSKLIQLKRVGIADTTIASISGKIYFTHLNKHDTLIDNFACASIWVKDLKTDSLIGTISNSKGEFQFTIPASEYDLHAQFIGYNKIKIKNIKVGTGDIVKFSAKLGKGDGETIYEWNPTNFYKNRNG